LPFLPATPSPPPLSPLSPYPTLFRSDFPRSLHTLRAAGRLGDRPAVCARVTAALSGERDQRNRPAASEHEHGHLNWQRQPAEQEDRKSTRLNSSHQIISYAVFCLKTK